MFAPGPPVWMDALPVLDDAEWHRPLMRESVMVPGPASERLVWGMGDGSGLRVLDTPVGRVASLICWENYMPLARFHFYAQGPEIWLAPTLATCEVGIATMRHIARESGSS